MAQIFMRTTFPLWSDRLILFPLRSGKVKSGALNDHPSMTDLDEGDLKFSVDYRNIYATVMEKWLGIESKSILGKQFKTMDLFEA